MDAQRKIVMILSNEYGGSVSDLVMSEHEYAVIKDMLDWLRSTKFGVYEVGIADQKLTLKRAVSNQIIVPAK